MAGYKYLEGNKEIGFIFPYQDIMVSMTEALRDSNLSAYIDLVSHFRNMSILSFDKKDLENLEKIDKIIVTFKTYIEEASKKKMENSTLYSIENINYMYEKNHILKNTCEFKFAGVVERICISALRKTVFKDQLPEAQTGIFYDPSRDIQITIQNFNSILEENEIPGLHEMKT